MRNQSYLEKAEQLAEIVTNTDNPDDIQAAKEQAQAYLKFKERGWHSEASRILAELFRGSEAVSQLKTREEAEEALPGVEEEDIARLSSYIDQGDIV